MRKAESLTLVEVDHGVEKKKIREEVRRDIAAWGGNLGSAILTLLLPFTVYYLYTCAYFFGFRVTDLHIWDLKRWPEFARFFKPTWQALAIYAAWFFFQGILYLVLPGPVFQARPSLDRAETLRYKMNGLLAFIVTFIAYYFCAFRFKLFSPTIAIDNLPALLTVVQLWSLALSIWLWVRGRFIKGNLYHTGMFFADFWAGLELNPRSLFGLWDHKYFCAGRPGLNGWVMLNVQFLVSHWLQGGCPKIALYVSTILQTWYIIDCWVFEPALTNILDIVFDRFGFMLVFGDLVWVPFTYTLVNLKIFMYGGPSMHPVYVGIVSFLHVVGYLLFRGTNWQKHLFKTKPEKYAHWQSMKTSKGTSLLIGGFFGFVRHFNYTGDLLMALAWCLCSGFDVILSYFYFIYFTALLIHRQFRDERRCAAKYGDDWKKYCEIAPYRLIPFVF